MTTINQKGGIFVGKSHAQGGIDIVIPETGQQIEVEGNEPLIPREALQDATIRTYKGTNFDILNQINTSIGAKSINQKATTVHAGDVIICKKTLHDKTVKTLQGTNKQIVSAINENAGCNVIEPGAKMKTQTGEIVQFKDGGTVAEKNNLYQEWKRLVNMTKKELEDFRKTPEGKRAGLTKSEAKKKGISSGQESAEWILKMKDTPKEEWTDEMWGWAKKQINFIKRMSGVKGSLYDKKGNKTRKHTALLIWGHNPEKETNMGQGGETVNLDKYWQEGFGRVIFPELMYNGEITNKYYNNPNFSGNQAKKMGVYTFPITDELRNQSEVLKKEYLEKEKNTDNPSLSINDIAKEVAKKINGKIYYKSPSGSRYIRNINEDGNEKTIRISDHYIMDRDSLNPKYRYDLEFVQREFNKNDINDIVSEINQETKMKNGGETQIPMNDLLTDLYKDHHEAWDFMEKISSEVNENNCSECAKKIISLFHKELNHHFNEEENDFFPWVLQQENKTLNKLIIDELIEQHHWFISRIKLMEEKPTPEKIKEFCNKLIEHIKLEEYLMNKFKQDPFKNTDMENQPTNNPKDAVTMNIPLLIRTLELAREDMETDAELHHMVERLIELKDKEVLTMDDYNFIEGVENNPKVKKYRGGGETQKSKPISYAKELDSYLEKTSNGIWFTEDIGSIHGAYFVLFPTDKHTKEDVDAAKKEIRNNRDAIGIKLADEDDWDSIYKTLYFRIPTTKPLRWYEIEQDEKLIRSERKKGTTPAEFVTKFVLPNVEKNKAKMLEKHGKSIYEMANGGELPSSKPTNQQVKLFLEEIGEELNYLYEKPVNTWDEYDKSNWIAKVKKHTKMEKGGELPISYDEEYIKQDYSDEISFLKKYFNDRGLQFIFVNENDNYVFFKIIYDKTDSHIFEVWKKTLYETPILDVAEDLFTRVKDRFLKYQQEYKKGGELPTSNLQPKTAYDEFKVIFEDENGKPQEEIHIYYSDALASFNKHKEQNHYVRLEGWNDNGQFDVIFRTPRFKEGDKVQMFDEEPVLTITEVIEWSDKSPTYNLSSANGVIDRRNISETKITKANKQFADGGTISEKEAFKKLMEPKTIEELKDSVDKIKKEFEEKKNSEEYQPYIDIPNYGTAIYVAQSNFFSYIVSYQPEMLTPFLEAIQSAPKANRFKLNRIFESHPDESITRFLENLKQPLWKLIPASFRNVAKVNQLPFKPEPDNKHLATITDLFVGKDGLRQTMTGVYFDTKNNKVVATNAHIMLIINAKPIIKEEAICYMSNTKSKLFKELEGNEQIISKTKDGCYQIEGTYPRYDVVVPTEFNEVITVNTYNLYKFCAITLKADLVSPITNQIFVRVNNEMEVGFNADFLAKSLKAMLFLGHDMVDLCFINKNKALVIVPKGKSREISYSGGINTDLVLVMPLRGLEDPEDNFFSYNLMDNCIYNHGKLESLGCVNINDDTEVASVKNGTTEFKKGDFVHKKNTNNKHYIVDAVNGNKLDLTNTVSLKKLVGVNAVDYVLVKPEEVESVKLPYEFNKRKVEGEELRKKHPIVLEWTEGADMTNKPYSSIEELEKDLASFGFTDSPNETYIKNKVWFKGYPHYVRIDISKGDHDFNPEEDKLINWLKNYDKSFDFEQFSSEAEKKNKERAAEKERIQQAQRQKTSKQVTEAIQVLQTLQNLTFEAEEKANIQKEIDSLKSKKSETNNDKLDDIISIMNNKLKNQGYSLKELYDEVIKLQGSRDGAILFSEFIKRKKDEGDSDVVDEFNKTSFVENVSVNQLNSSKQDLADEKKVVRDNYYITSFGENFTEVNPLKNLTIEGIDVFIYEYDYDKDLIGIAHLPTGLVLTGSSYKGKEDYLINQLKGMIKDVGKQKLLSKLDSSKLSPRYDINSLPFEEKNFQDIKKLYEDKNFEELYKYISNNQNITSRQSLSKILNKNIVKYNKKEIIDLFKSFGYDVEKIENEKRLLEEEENRKELEEKNNKVATYKKEEYPYLKLENMSAKQFATLDKAMQKQWRFQDDGIMTLSNWIKKHKDDIIGVKESVSKYTKRGEERTSPLTEYFLQYNKDNSVYLRDIPKLAYDNWNKEWNK